MYKMRNIMNPAVCYIQKLLGGWILKVLITRGKYEMLDVRWTYCDDHFMTLCQIMMLEGNGTPLQNSCLENPMDGGAWKAAVRGVAEGRTRLSDFTFTFHFHALEKEMATHSSVLAWRIPEMGMPGGLPSMGSHRVRHDWSDLAVAAYCLHDCSFVI